MFPCQRWHKEKTDTSIDISILKHLYFFVLSVPHDENVASCAFKNLLVWLNARWSRTGLFCSWGHSYARLLSACPKKHMNAPQCKAKQSWDQTLCSGANVSISLTQTRSKRKKKNMPELVVPVLWVLQIKYLSRYIWYLEIQVLYGSTLGDENNQEEYTKRELITFKRCQTNSTTWPMQKKKRKGSTLQHSCAALLVLDSRKGFSLCPFLWHSLLAFCLLLLVVSSKSQIWKWEQSNQMAQNQKRQEQKR